MLKHFVCEASIKSIGEIYKRKLLCQVNHNFFKKLAILYKDFVTTSFIIEKNYTLCYTYYAKKDYENKSIKRKNLFGGFFMKFARKLLSITLAFVMIFGCVAAMSVSADETSFYASANNDEYDDNIAISYDQFIRDYSYGTELTSNWPRQITFNKYGWARLQSQTAEEYAAYQAAKAVNDEAAMAANEGTYDHQWQLHCLPTPEYQTQFRNAVAYALENTGGTMSMYFYIKSARVAYPNDSGDPAKDTYSDKATIDCTCIFDIGVDLDGDGEYEESIKVGMEGADSEINTEYGFRYKNVAVSVDELYDYIAVDGFNAENICLKSILIQPRYYENKGQKNSKGQMGIGLVDVIFSPVYVKNIPGSTYGFDDCIMFDAETAFANADADFTANKLGAAMDVANWTWEPYEAKTNDDHLPIYGSLGYADIMREDGTNYPIKNDGTKYAPVPVGKITEDEKVVITSFKATNVTTNSVTLSWATSGGKATTFAIGEATGKFNKTVDGSLSSYTITGLTPGTSYQFRIKGINSKQGDFSSYITVKTTAAAPAKPVIKTAAVSAKNQVKVTWGAAANAKTYKVERKIGSGAWATVGTVSTTYFVDKTTKAGTYSYRVTAISATGAKSAASAYKNVAVMSFSAKAKITTSVGKKKVTITVKTKVANASGYEYVVATDSKFKKNVKSTKTSKAKATLSKLKKGKVYYARVRAYKTINGKKVAGAWSKAVKTKKVK